jgi:hypothetical protein
MPPWITTSGLSITYDHGYVSFVVIAIPSFSHCWIIIGILTRAIRRVPLLDQELLTHRITWYHYLIRNYLPVVSPGTTTWSGTTYPSYHLVPLLDQELLTHRITWYHYLIRNCLPIVSPGTTTWSGTTYPSFIPVLQWGYSCWIYL